MQISTETSTGVVQDAGATSSPRCDELPGFVEELGKIVGKWFAAQERETYEPITGTTRTGTRPGAL